MTKLALTISAEMHVKYAIRLLALRRSLVLREEQVVGLVTLRDLVLGYEESEGPGS